MGRGSLLARATTAAPLLAGLTALVLVSCGNGVAGPSSTPPPEQAITGFDPSHAAIRTSFANLDTSARDHPDALRQAALGHLQDFNPQVHYAAVYSLALTVTSTQGSNQMVALLTAASLNDRLLAAAALTGIGHGRGLPVPGRPLPHLGVMREDDISIAGDGLRTARGAQGPGK